MLLYSWYSLSCWGILSPFMEQKRKFITFYTRTQIWALLNVRWI